MADFIDLSTTVEPFVRIGAYGVFRFNLAPVTADDVAEQVTSAYSTAGVFEVLGVHPLLGRVLQQDDDEAGSPDVVVISERFWKRKFAGKDPTGSVVTVNTKPYTVVGVVPSSFEFPTNEVQLWISVKVMPSAKRTPAFLHVIGRLGPAASLNNLRDRLATVSGVLQRSFPREYSQRHFVATTLLEDIVGSTRRVLWLLQAMALAVLAISIVNVANLSLGRTLAREQETAIRRSLGASRSQVIRVLLLDSVVVCIAGAGFGLALTWGVLRWFRQYGRAWNLPRMTDLSLDPAIIIVALALCVFAVVGIGLIPAFWASRCGASVRSGTRSDARTDQRHTVRARAALVVVEVGLCFVLLVAGTIMVRSFRKARNIETGFVALPSDLLIVQVFPSGVAYTKEHRIAFYEELTSRISHLPGVESVAVSGSLPPDKVTFTNGFEVEGQSPTEHSTSVPVPIVSSTYFRTLGIPLVNGRVFQTSDSPDAPPVVVVSRSLADTYFKGQNAVGKRIRESESTTGDGERPWMEIVGVVEDVRYQGPTADFVPVYYRHTNQLVFPFWNYLTVRSKSPGILLRAVEATVHSLDRGVPVSGATTMRELMERSLTQAHLRAVLFGVAAVLGIVLAAVGTYAVMSYAVVQRTHEIGIRMAVGAGRSAILRQVLGEGLRLGAMGIVTGVLGGLALARSFDPLLFRTSAFEAPIYIGAAAYLLVVVLVACVLPALRAAGIDPMVALRSE